MIGVGIGLRPRRPFDPGTLLAGGAPAIWIDPSDMGAMFQDAGGTVRAVVDGPVGLIRDRSGRGNHATQSVDAFRPALRREADGRLALEFDGVDDFLHHPFAVLGTDATLSCAAQRRGGGTAVAGLFLATPAQTRLQAGVWGQSAAPDWGSYAAGAYRSAGADASTRAVLTNVGRAAPDTQRLLTNGARPVDYTGSFAGDSHDRRAIGREFAALVTGHFSGRLYALFGIARALNEDELRALVVHQAGQAGVMP